MDHKTKSSLVLKVVIALAAFVVTVGLLNEALPGLAKLFSRSPLAPPPSPTALRGAQVSPLGTPIPLSSKSPTTPTTIPTVPPPPGWPTDVPWPVTPEPPKPTPTHPADLAPLGQPAVDEQSLYYVVDNAGFPEFHIAGLDAQGKQQSEFKAGDESVLKGMHLIGMYPSPSGKYVALELANLGGYVEIKIMERASGQTWCPFDDPARCWGAFRDWLPDERLLFQPLDAQPADVIPWGIMVVDVKTGQYAQPANLPTRSSGTSRAQNVSASPNGTLLAYSVVEVENREEFTEIWTQETNSKNKQLIRRIKGSVTDLSWSPDGNMLSFVFQSEPGQFFPGELWLMNADGSGARLMASNLPLPGEARYQPTWSPDGRYIAFVQMDNATAFYSAPSFPTLAWSHVSFADVKTGKTTRLSAFERQEATYPTWSPNGQSIAFVSTAVTNTGSLLSEIWNASIDGKQLNSISKQAQWGNALAWLPPLSAESTR